MVPLSRYAYVETSASELKLVDTLSDQVSASIAVGSSNGGYLSLAKERVYLGRQSSICAAPNC
jgi:hypothetical protein